MEDNGSDRPARGGVVVGYDGSPPAEVAVDWAAAEAARRGVGLHVVYAADYRGVVPSPIGVLPWMPESAFDAAREVAEEGAARARKIAVDVAITQATVVGSAAGSLVDAAEGAALLVVGTRGHGDLLGAMLGSVAFSVSSHAPCPVVVVRGSGSPACGPDAPVVVGVDGSPAAEAALAFAARTAAETRAPLMLLAAWHPGGGETWQAEYWTAINPSGSPMSSARRAAEDVAAAGAEQVRRDHPEVDVRTMVVVGPAGRALADASVSAGLLVVGARGRGGFTGLLLGSVSHATIHAAHCPVAVVRA
jgi:nucleotide-binding universal stress UspA family protein